MPTPILGGGLPPGVSKLVNVATYRHSDFGMSFGTDTPAKMPEFGGGEGGVSKTNQPVEKLPRCYFLTLVQGPRTPFHRFLDLFWWCLRLSWNHPQARQRLFQQARSFLRWDEKADSPRSTLSRSASVCGL